MALVLDETFATGIPPSFATARAQAGTLSATWNSGAQAVDLSNATVGQNIWDITSVPLSAQGEMEIDLEFVSDYSGATKNLAGGAWALAGNAAVSNGIRFLHNQSNYQADTWSGAVSWNGNAAASLVAQGTMFPFATPGDRRTFNIRWDMNAGAHLTYECRIDGSLILFGLALYASLRPGVFLYAAAVRLHSIKAWDAPQAPLALLGTRGLDPALARRICAPPKALLPGPPLAVNRGAVFGWRNTYQGGAGRVHGTVKEKGTPNNPVHRRVRLFDELSALLVREQWSDPITGAYSFDYVDMARRYTVISYDHTGAFRAVVADGQLPELIA